MMLTPRYFFTNDFNDFYEYFLSRPHKKRTFPEGSCLWKPGEPFGRIHYIISGVEQSYVEHESGRKKILSFHGSGTVFPGYHQQDYRIESSIVTTALSPMEVLEFSKEQFRSMFEENSALSARIIEWFSMYVNLLLYDTAHQEYNCSFHKLCNLLYLLLVDENKRSPVHIPQSDLADILGISRVHLTRGLARLREENIIVTNRRQIIVTDPSALAKYCSMETL